MTYRKAMLGIIDFEHGPTIIWNHIYIYIYHGYLEKSAITARVIGKSMEEARTWKRRVDNKTRILDRIDLGRFTFMRLERDQRVCSEP